MADMRTVEVNLGGPEPGQQLIVPLTEVSPGIGVCHLDLSDIRSLWKNFAGPVSEAGNLKKVSHLPSWGSNWDPCGAMGFNAYVQQLISLLREGSKAGKTLLENVLNLSPVPYLFAINREAVYPGSILGGTDLNQDIGGAGENRQILLDTQGRDSGIRVVVFNGGTNILNSWVAPRNMLRSADGTGTYAIMSLPWGAVLQYQGHILRPEIMLGSLLAHASLILTGAMDYTEVHVPLSLKNQYFVTQKMPMWQVHTTGNHAAIRYLNALDFEFDLTKAYRDSLDLAKAFAEKATESTAKSTAKAVETAREKVLGLTEADISKDFGLPRRHSFTPHGPHYILQAMLRSSPARFKNAYAVDAAKAWTHRYLTRPVLLWDPSRKSDFAKSVVNDIWDAASKVLVVAVAGEALITPDRFFSANALFELAADKTFAPGTAGVTPSAVLFRLVSPSTIFAMKNDIEKLAFISEFNMKKEAEGKKIRYQPNDPTLRDLVFESMGKGSSTTYAETSLLDKIRDAARVVFNTEYAHAIVDNSIDVGTHAAIADWGATVLDKDWAAFLTTYGIPGLRPAQSTLANLKDIFSTALPVLDYIPTGSLKDWVSTIGETEDEKRKIFLVKNGIIPDQKCVKPDADDASVLRSQLKKDESECEALFVVAPSDALGPLPKAPDRAPVVVLSGTPGLHYALIIVPEKSGYAADGSPSEAACYLVDCGSSRVSSADIDAHAGEVTRMLQQYAPRNTGKIVIDQVYVTSPRADCCNLLPKVLDANTTVKGITCGGLPYRYSALTGISGGVNMLEWMEGKLAPTDKATVDRVKNAAQFMKAVLSSANVVIDGVNKLIDDFLTGSAGSDGETGSNIRWLRATDGNLIFPEAVSGNGKLFCLAANQGANASQALDDDNGLVLLFVHRDLRLLLTGHAGDVPLRTVTSQRSALAAIGNGGYDPLLRTDEMFLAIWGYGAPLSSAQLAWRTPEEVKAGDLYPQVAFTTPGVEPGLMAKESSSLIVAGHCQVKPPPNGHQFLRRYEISQPGSKLPSCVYQFSSVV
ncbi:hypothetical protein [Streptomyces formicae]|uniref:Uncharacterized protein n=1 Tax=Streptomyces formicae TaxID=1616117 RepID=A0ABY3WQN3_9ACTN|nr:hypothetical protein [Streptomyces formicae]UNM14959.1 hypothetical protein J4032_28955 [Streptomyces formicae]